MIGLTMPTSMDKRKPYQYMIENITEVEQHKIGFLKHPMFPDRLGIGV